jgi:hypothetical protein
VVVTAGPTRTAAVLLLLAGCAAALLSLVADPAGRVLLLPAAALVVALGLRDLLLRPVLQADASGLEVVTGLRRLQAPWSDVERLRVVTDRRTPVLELDLGTAVVVLGRLRLGRAPVDVLDELQALRAVS